MCAVNIQTGKHMCCMKTSKGLEHNLRSELLVAYTESTINFEKFISVAGSFYL